MKRKMPTLAKKAAATVASIYAALVMISCWLATALEKLPIPVRAFVGIIFASVLVCMLAGIAFVVYRMVLEWLEG